jgi:hypothetical protein
MKKMGVWIDKRSAKVITIGEKKDAIQDVASNVESFRPKGGSGTRMKGGPQDVVQDSKYLEREKHQLRAYFKEIASYLTDADSFVVFGPAESGTNFAKELSDNHKHLFNRLEGVRKADSMTDNQLVAWVKEFYKKK